MRWFSRRKIRNVEYIRAEAVGRLIPTAFFYVEKALKVYRLPGPEKNIMITKK